MTAPWARKRAAAHPPTVAPIGHEKLLVFRVQRKRGDAFEVARTWWDEGDGIEVGTEAWYLYADDAPDEGYPIFPTAEHRTGRGDPVERARDELVKALGRG